MKVSELIHLLNVARGRYGDVEVTACGEEAMLCVDTDRNALSLEGVRIVFSDHFEECGLKEVKA